MDENNPLNDSESFGKDEKGSESGSESFGKLRKDSEKPLENQSESFGKSQETFGKLRKASESPQESFGKVRKENHILTVKEVLKIFESKNVDITERSIINYCHPNKYGVSLLDCYLDQNERKYFITPESAERAVEEVKARKIRLNKGNHEFSEDLRKGPESSLESFGKVRNDSETEKTKKYEEDIKNLKQENLDLKITNRGKDYFIEQMKSERAELITKIEDSARLIGELETKLQIGPPKEKETENMEEVKIHDTDSLENNWGEQETEGDEEAKPYHINIEKTKTETPVSQKPNFEEIMNEN